MDYRPYLIIAVTVTVLLFVVLLLKRNNVINSELFDTLGIALVIAAISFSVLVKTKSKNENFSGSQQLQ